ncbi:MAG: hypothetical protein ACOY82_10845 [Pseudomonadota bacterium]
MDHDAIRSVTSIVQAVTGALVPILVIGIGLALNRKLESTKTALAREKDWKTKWAEAFYLAATGFTKSVDECMCLLSEFAELDGKADPVSAQRRAELEAAIGKEFRNLHRQEWGLRTQLQYAPRNEGDVIRAKDGTLQEMHSMVRTSRGSFEVVRHHLKAFNNACKKAYLEMLET